MPLFVPLDVDYMSDPKIMRLKDPLSELLYVRALCFAKRTLSDGFIHDAQLGLLCTGIGRDVARPGRMVDRLVRDLDACGLWRRVQDGYEIVAWSKRNLSAATIRENSDKRRLAGQKANHERWHVNGKWSSDCPFCVRNGIRIGQASDPILSESESTESETESETESDTSDRIDVSTTRTVRTPVVVAEAVAIYVEADMTARSVTDIRNPASYRESVARNVGAKFGAAMSEHLAAHPAATALELATEVLGVDEFTARQIAKKRDAS